MKTTLTDFCKKHSISPTHFYLGRNVYEIDRRDLRGDALGEVKNLEDFEVYSEDRDHVSLISRRTI